MRKFYFFIALLLLSINNLAAQTISLTSGTYIQDFNALVNTVGTTTNNLTINGWLMTESGGGARDNEQYAVDNGGSNTGDTYSYGLAANTDRALGGLRSGTLIPIFGAAFTNNSGLTINSLTINFAGEMWRAGVTNRNAADRLDFQLSTNATSIGDAVATWTDYNNLDYNSTNILATAGALDGNNGTNRTAVSFTITGLNIPNGATFYIRWTDFDIASSDDGLSIDDFSLGFTTISNLSVSAAAGTNAAEPSTSGTFNISLSGGTAPAGGIIVTYTLSGSALQNTDYTDPQAGSVTIPQGNTSTTVTLNVNDDPDVEGTETIQITLNTATIPVVIGTANATINLNDNDLPPNPYISLVSSYSQDFNTLANTGTSSTLPTGWLLNETGTGANTTYTAGTGSSNAGDSYSFGAASNAERAFGGLQSGSVIPTIGAQIQNNSGNAITKLKISYTGEEWRLGTADRTDKLSFEISFNATTLSNGTWSPVTNLDFITPNTSSPVGAKDGNAVGNKTSIVYTLRDLSIPNSAVFLIRWTDFNASGADDGLAVDDFTIEANPVDVIPPVINVYNPANGSTNVSLNIGVAAQFNEDVQKGTGNIRIRRTTDNSIFQTINVSSASVIVNSTVVSFALGNLEANTGYYIEIDNGAFKDLDNNNFAGISGSSTWSFTTGINMYVANFQTCTAGLSDGFTQFSQVGAITWACTTFGRDPSNPAGTAPFPNGVQINGFAGGTNVPNTDWLISPSFNLTGTTYPLLSFWSRTAFNGQPLLLKVSTDYVSGDPSLATWVDINGKFPAQTSNIWTLSENINLSAFKQSNVHFAFVYFSDDDEGARWTIDDVALGNSPVPPPPSLTVSTTDIHFAFTASGNTSTKTFTFIGNDLTNNISLNATGSFSLSKDNVTYSSSLLYTIAEANNLSKTVYVKFAPTQNNQNFTGSIAIATGALAASVNLAGTSIDPATTLEVVNWNIEWFGSSTNGPTNDALQEQNVKTVLQNLNADIYAVSEIVSESKLAGVVAQMPGYAYVISNYGSHSNPNSPTPSPLAEAQKLAFIYKTSVFSNISTTALLSQGINSAADISNPAYNYWASGRFPFMLSADVTLNCITRNVKFILVHAKANTSPTATSYDRRKRGADTLRYLLQNSYANDNIVILGDYNDDLDVTITAGINPPVTSWSAFTTDVTNFTAVTLPLSLAGKRSTVSFNDVIDHVTLSNDMLPYYMNATATIVTDVTSLVSNYGSTTSDHYPVFSRYIFENKIAPQVTTCPAVSPFCQNNTNTYAIPLFVATDDCDAVSYSYSISGATTRSGNTNNASGTFNTGTSIITWTATDNWGNTASCQTTVLVNVKPSVNIPDAYALPSGVLANTVYIGYAPASSITLTAVISGGTPAYSYNWSSGSTVSTTTVNPVVNTLYTVIVSDANGCSSAANKTVNVIDIRGGNKNDKVKVCHNSNTIIVDGNSMIAHLAHGDMLGACNSNSITSVTKREVLALAGRLVLSAMPNPSANSFQINIKDGLSNEKANLRITDIFGRTIEQKIVQTNQTFKIGDNYHSGVYLIEVMQGKEKAIIKLVKL